MPSYTFMTERQREHLEKLIFLANGDSDLVDKAIREVAVTKLVDVRSGFLWLRKDKVLKTKSDLGDVVRYIEANRKPIRRAA